ncbi:hypothetical protein DICPUDRAFT_153660 [Dictyostelium purpureum]|uniref:Transmembrane protein 208 n=1 Tax=Dictyostelium purpureum TaxID=5786 RepID=F0ZPF9_DICPU|nr:uncharacterized protein DICPUDRAFT_153660 [Dictyostelium purpureum]EGC34199.1 hypothetical protein DICPUDRAFT_153660 [Dictyostelium purpureum]|eukprot:XP_003289303.1 hypothetical protein DICPUDRAFT_153660 [Dictyostelium purpureum]
MANAAAKKRKQQNDKEMIKLKLIVACTTIPYICYRIFYNKETFGGWTMYGYFFIQFLNLLAFYLINTMCQPTFDQSGELIDGGSDLTMGGLTEYYFDIIYVCAIVQFLGLFSDKSLYLVLIVPIFAGYKLWTSIIQPYFLNRPKQTDAQGDKSKRREKMEKKAEKMKFKNVR